MNNVRKVDKLPWPCELGNVLLKYKLGVAESNGVITPPPIGDGYCFRSISLFFCLFLCQQDYEKTAGPICMKFSGKVWSDHGPRRDDLIKFRVNSGIWVGWSKVNLLSPDIAIWFDCSLLAVLCCHLTTENVMKLLLLPFCYIATRAGRGLLCFTPQLVKNRIRYKTRLTAQQHGEYGENLLGVGDGCHVSEPDASYDGEAEIERRDVARPDIRSARRVVGQVRHAGPM